MIILAKRIRINESAVPCICELASKYGKVERP